MSIIPQIFRKNPAKQYLDEMYGIVDELDSVVDKAMAAQEDAQKKLFLDGMTEDKLQALKGIPGKLREVKPDESAKLKVNLGYVDEAIQNLEEFLRSVKGGEPVTNRLSYISGIMLTLKVQHSDYLKPGYNVLSLKGFSTASWGKP